MTNHERLAEAGKPKVKNYVVTFAKQNPLRVHSKVRRLLKEWGGRP